MKRYRIVSMIILIIGIFLLIWFAIPVAKTGNFRNIGSWTGLGISVLLILYGIWMPHINRLLAAGWRTLAGKILEIFLMVIAFCILVLATLCIIAMVSACHGGDSSDTSRTVIVLGARVYENRVSISLASRLHVAYTYLMQHPDAVCVVSGGQGDNEPCTEASLMFQYLQNRGIEAGRIYMEDQSEDTQENLAFSRQLIEKEGLNPQVVIATDGYHVYRALCYAADVGLDAQPLPAATVWWQYPTCIIREMYGILERWFLK